MNEEYKTYMWKGITNFDENMGPPTEARQIIEIISLFFWKQIEMI